MLDVRYIAYNMIGVVVTHDYLSSLMDELYKNDRTYKQARKDYSVPEILVAWLAIQDYSNVEDYIKFIVVDSKELAFSRRDCYFIGVELNRFPEHLSIKRMRVDVRNLLERFAIISSDESPDAVKLLELCIDTIGEKVNDDQKD
jgi:hypothetical protein